MSLCGRYLTKKQQRKLNSTLAIDHISENQISYPCCVFDFEFRNMETPEGCGSSSSSRSSVSSGQLSFVDLGTPSAIRDEWTRQ